jgi:hypothetical protein
MSSAKTCKTCGGSGQLGPPLVQGWLPCWHCKKDDFHYHQIAKTLNDFQGQSIDGPDDVKAITDALVRAIKFI